MKVRLSVVFGVLVFIVGLILCVSLSETKIAPLKNNVHLVK